MYIVRFVSLVLLFWMSSLSATYGIEIKYRFKPGYNYHYEVTSKQSSVVNAPDFKSEPKPTTIKNKFLLRIINVKNDVAIIDIVTSNAIRRRYIKSTGNIVGAPTEPGKLVPMFLTFPSKNWKIGKKVRITKMLKIGTLAIEASTNMLLKNVDKTNSKAEILFKTAIPLPSDKLKKKTFLMKGKIVFDIKQGCVEQLIWRYSYKCSIINKEIAVKRHLWDFSENKHIVLKLIKVEKASK